MNRELDIHCLNAINPSKNIALWDCASSEFDFFIVLIMNGNYWFA